MDESAPPDRTPLRSDLLRHWPCRFRPRPRNAATPPARRGNRRRAPRPALFLRGAAIGHVLDMVRAGNFAPGGAGVTLWTDVPVPVVGFILSHMTARDWPAYQRPVRAAARRAARARNSDSSMSRPPWARRSLGAAKRPGRRAGSAAAGTSAR
ncbi:MAG: DUF6790 family protein, partial [Amaricoccus sp.]|uniref:DUF6790 family protein n=1 Tax=Amaricoccus sp. TaxID=1872485 RepID=UPI0033151852